MVDLISCLSPSDCDQARDKLLAYFPQAKITSTFKSHYKPQLYFNCDLPESSYIIGLIELGLALHSNKFHAMIETQVEDLLTLMTQYEARLNQG